MHFQPHFSFTFEMMRRHRQALAKIYAHRQPRLRLQDISPQSLKRQGIEVLVLDFDGVLAAHGETVLTPELHSWLQSCVATFGTERVFILSNQPRPDRIAYFRQHFAEVRCLVGVKKKPDPQGLEQVMKLTGRPATALLLVDDRLWTGGLAACIAKVRFIYITRPYIKFSKRPVQELFFMTLRFLERRWAQLS